MTGGWVVEDYYHFRGKKYSETTTSLGRFPVDASGRLDARFVVPEDYGGVHEVIALIDGKPVAQSAHQRHADVRVDADIRSRRARRSS